MQYIIQHWKTTDYPAWPGGVAAPINQTERSNLSGRRRGGSSTSEQICADVELPPRPRLSADAFGDILLTARPPRPAKRGDRPALRRWNIRTRLKPYHRLH